MNISKKDVAPTADLPTVEIENQDQEQDELIGAAS